jgi:hypothetical protein
LFNFSNPAENLTMFGSLDMLDYHLNNRVHCPNLSV